MKLEKDFKEFLQLLTEHKVQYLLIGGYAVVFYGFPRTTGDIDIWISDKSRNIEKTIKALKEFGFDLPELNEHIFQKDKIIRMGNPPFRIELMTDISGVDFNECYNSRHIVNIDGQEISIISKEDLIKNKKAANRYKDLNDLENLS
ncbi:nucleotidyltransferase [Bacteroidota bacterium]